MVRSISASNEPLISLELFEKAQDALIPNRTNNAGKKRSYVLRDFMHCDECGCKITAGTHKGVLCNFALADQNIGSYQYKRPFDVLEKDAEGAFCLAWSG